MAHPEMRASLVKEQLAAIDDHAEGARVRAAVAPATLARIESATRVDWLPIETLLALLDATLATLGPEAAAAHWRRSTMRAFETPLVKPFTDGVVALFQPSPPRVFPLLPKLFQLIYRGIGRVLVENPAPDRLRVIHERVPAVMLASPAWSPSIAASYVASLDFLHVSAPAVDTEVDAAHQRVVFTLRWR
jgi:hypothetical protein